LAGASDVADVPNEGEEDDLPPDMCSDKLFGLVFDASGLHTHECNTPSPDQTQSDKHDPSSPEKASIAASPLAPAPAGLASGNKTHIATRRSTSRALEVARQSSKPVRWKRPRAAELSLAMDLPKVAESSPLVCPAPSDLEAFDHAFDPHSSETAISECGTSIDALQRNTVNAENEPNSLTTCANPKTTFTKSAAQFSEKPPKRTFSWQSLNVHPKAKRPKTKAIV